MQTSAHLTVAQIGLAGSTYTWVFAVAQFFSGTLLDRFGSWPILTAAVALVTVGAFLYAGTTGFATLAIAQVVLALGASFGFVGAGYIGGSWFDAARYGLMFGLVQALASLGSAVGQPLVLVALHALTWQQLIVGFAAFGVLLVVLFAAFVRNRPDGTPPHATSDDRVEHETITVSGALARCFRSRQVLISSLIAGASFGTMLAIGTLWGPRMMESRGFSTAFATVLTAVAWLGLAVGAPIVNVVSDRWRSRRGPAVGALLLQGIAVALVIALPSPGSGAAIVLMFAVGLFSGVQMLGFTIASEAVDRHLIGTAAAIVNGVCFVLGGVLLGFPGTLLPDAPSLQDYKAALWPMPALIAIAAIGALFLRTPRTDRQKETLA
ncbi:MFS transporter [Curtobacterium sp. PhB191]|uniref:MFS transporter n=1 Tax=Curtobacterium sp. PhB191 TaxID=2485202 RepID=UPI00104A93DB|nr:MFS transporter [Curtobacterium sp. PhB191]